MSEERKLTFMGAINEAIDQSMEQDDNVILIGTDVSGGGVEHIKDDDTFGGVFGVTKGLAKKYSRDRVIDTNRRAYYTQLCCRCSSYRYASYCRINVQ